MMAMASSAPVRNTGRKLAPSRSTAYISNIPFGLTNTDLHKIFEKFGKLVKVTILRDKETRKSKGVAFLLYLEPESAVACVKATNGCQMFGRTLKANIAKDNGRASEFIRRREYPNKSRCYECGEFGHLSYICPKNILGDREPPKKKKKVKRPAILPEDDVKEDNEDDDDSPEEEEESLSAAIRYQQKLHDAEVQQGPSEPLDKGIKRKQFRPSKYFSDEEETSD